MGFTHVPHGVHCTLPSACSQGTGWTKAVADSVPPGTPVWPTRWDPGLGEGPWDQARSSWWLVPCLRVERPRASGPLEACVQTEL